MSIYVRPPNARTRERDADKMEQAAKVYDEKTLVDCLHANPLGMVKDGAATLGPGGMDIYEWYDQNGDMSAKVSAVRAAAMWMNLVTNKLSLPHNNEVADADGDGMLDAEEFQALFDLDGDGDISEHEKAKAYKMFAMVDKDGDGQLTQEELKQLANAQPEKFKARAM